MFTGIVEEIGAVRAGGSARLAVTAATVTQGLRPGDSIAVNGVCLTVVTLDPRGFEVETMPETLRLSNLGSLRGGEPVNLERALAAGSRIGGHFVQGHVDGQGEIASVRPDGNALIVRFEALPPIMRYVVAKGFIAVDGASLTVVDCDQRSFRVSLVGYTQGHVTLARKRPGYRANLEVDILGKYVEKLACGSPSGISEAFLAEHGMLDAKRGD